MEKTQQLGLVVKWSGTPGSSKVLQVIYWLG